MTARRKLSDFFMSNLCQADGILSPILKRTKRDQTLDFEIRENEVHIYYRGGRILQIKSASNYFTCGFDAEYAKEWPCPKFPSVLKEQADSESVVAAIPLLKEVMDFFFAEHKDKSEREFQQLIVRENNYSIISNATDYFIVDLEYATPGARFDLVAIKWDSNGTKRQKNGLVTTPPKLALCELKYYTAALDGKAGLLQHVEDAALFLSNEDHVRLLKKDALSIFEQKRKLQLVTFGPGGNANAVDRLD